MLGGVCVGVGRCVCGLSIPLRPFDCKGIAAVPRRGVISSGNSLMV